MGVKEGDDLVIEQFRCRQGRLVIVQFSRGPLTLCAAATKSRDEKRVVNT